MLDTCVKLKHLVWAAGAFLICIVIKDHFMLGHITDYLEYLSQAIR